MSNNRKISWGNLIVGIIFIIVALISFIDPTISLVTIVTVLAIAAIAEGIFQIFIRRRFRQATGYRVTVILITGIIDIAVGIILLTNLYKSIAGLPYIFAIWFIIRSIEGLLTSGLSKLISNEYYWFKVIVNIIGIVVGIMLFKNPLSSVLTITFLVGFNFMQYGILNIIEAFSNEIE